MTCLHETRSENSWGVRFLGEMQDKEWTEYLLDDLRASGIQIDQRIMAAPDEDGWYRTLTMRAGSALWHQYLSKCDRTY